MALYVTRPNVARNSGNPLAIRCPHWVETAVSHRPAVGRSAGEAGQIDWQQLVSSLAKRDSGDEGWFWLQVHRVEIAQHLWNREGVRAPKNSAALFDGRRGYRVSQARAQSSQSTAAIVIDTEAR